MHNATNKQEYFELFIVSFGNSSLNFELLIAERDSVGFLIQQVQLTIDTLMLKKA